MSESSRPMDLPVRLAPPSFVHWREMGEPSPDDTVVEYPLYSDAHILGSAVRLGPFTLLNAIAGYGADTRVPAMFLRVRFDERELVMPELLATRDEHYHGGHMLDEVAALLSLECGMRVFATESETRRFSPRGDPLGTPHSWRFGKSPPPILRREGRLIVPRAAGERHIDPGIRLLHHFPELQVADAAALVKAARLFQEAIWLVESAPELAWLLLSSAVEAAAVHREYVEVPSDVLLHAKPELTERLLVAGGEDLVSEVAEMLVNQAKATAKFVKFLLLFAPKLPEPRPPEWAQLDFSTKRRQGKVYSRIYELRSRALHAGIAFPHPMCSPPHNCEGVFSERPFGFGASVGTVTWRVEDTPLLLNTFVHLARGALMNWWESMLPESTDGSPANAPASS